MNNPELKIQTLICPSHIWSLEECDLVDNPIYLDERDRIKIGQRIKINALPSNIGYILYEVTKIDDGIWGIIIENTVQIINEWEV